MNANGNNDGLIVDHDGVTIALRDAWTGASEAKTEFDHAVEELTEVAETNGKGRDWAAAIKRLRRAANAAERATDAVTELLLRDEIET
jgi:broad specificity phosphatase PhoE